MQVARGGRAAPAPEPGRAGPPLAAAQAASGRGILARGVLGAVLCALAMSTLWAITVPAFWPVDELSHVPYARAVAQGRLPTIHTPIRAEGMPGIAERLTFERAADNDDRQDVWTSNHPPLYFLLAGAPLVVGEAVGAPGLGFLGARAVSVLAGALGVGLTAAVALVLVPGRPRIAVASAAFAALVPSLSHFSGLVFNDSMSFALCTLLVLCALLVLRGGADRWVVAVGAAGTAAALTRVAALPLVALAAVACAVGAWHAAAPGRPRWWAAVRAAGIAGALPALGAGWFYVRNWQRYGDPTGAQALLDKFDRDPNAELEQLVLGLRFYIGQWDRLLGDLSTGVWFEGWRIPVLRGLGIAIVLGLAVGAGRWLGQQELPPRWEALAARLRQPLRDGAATGTGWADGRWRRWAWPLLLAFPAGLLLATARFHAAGGSAHARYLLSALALVALVSVVGLDGLDRHGGGWPILAGLGSLVVLGLGVWVEFLRVGGREWIDDGRVYSMRTIGQSWNDLAVGGALVVLVVGLLLVARAVRDLPPASPLPRGDRPL